jgi:hypothetical protein
VVELVDRKGCRVEIKYHLDEHIDAAVAAGLRLRGVDVTTTVEQELQGASDLQQLAFAYGQGRVLVTCDSDFIVLSKAGRPHAGIVFWPARHVGQVASRSRLSRRGFLLARRHTRRTEIRRLALPPA